MTPSCVFKVGEAVRVIRTQFVWFLQRRILGLRRIIEPEEILSVTADYDEYARMTHVPGQLQVSGRQ